MYDNIGGKIKGLAKFIFFLETLGAVATGIAMLISEEAFGILVIIGGTLLAWVSSWLLYGFGQLIENSDIIAQEYNRKNIKHEKEATKQAERKEAQRRKVATSMVENPNVDEEEFIDITCPGCKAALSFTKGQLQSDEALTCPICDAGISL